MSLKAFHLIFIVASILLAFGFATWSLMDYYSAHGVAGDLTRGLCSLAAGLALVVYEVYFLRKFKNVSYL